MLLQLQYWMMYGGAVEFLYEKGQEGMFPLALCFQFFANEVLSVSGSGFDVDYLVVFDVEVRIGTEGELCVAILLEADE